MSCWWTREEKYISNINLVCFSNLGQKIWFLYETIISGTLKKKERKIIELIYPVLKLVCYNFGWHTKYWSVRYWPIFWSVHRNRYGVPFSCHYHPYWLVGNSNFTYNVRRFMKLMHINEDGCHNSIMFFFVHFKFMFTLFRRLFSF